MVAEAELIATTVPPRNERKQTGHLAAHPRRLNGDTEHVERRPAELRRLSGPSRPGSGRHRPRPPTTSRSRTPQAAPLTEPREAVRPLPRNVGAVLDESSALVEVLICADDLKFSGSSGSSGSRAAKVLICLLFPWSKSGTT